MTQPGCCANAQSLLSGQAPFLLCATGPDALSGALVWCDGTGVIVHAPRRARQWQPHDPGRWLKCHLRQVNLRLQQPARRDRVLHLLARLIRRQLRAGWWGAAGSWNGDRRQARRAAQARDWQVRDAYRGANARDRERDSRGCPLRAGDVDAEARYWRAGRGWGGRWRRRAGPPDCNGRILHFRECPVRHACENQQQHDRPANDRAERRR
jgi:hypothetical protein